MTWDRDRRDAASDAGPRRLITRLARAGACLAEALARRRVPLGFAFAAPVLLLARPTTRTLVAGGALACLGEALRIWAAGHLDKSREVTSSGPYRWLAHPLYVGSGVMGVGLALASGSAIAGLLIVAYLTATLTAAIRSEEAFLRRRFGDRYDRYRRGERVSGGHVRRFSLTRAVANREHRALAGLLLAGLLLMLKAAYNGVFWRAAGTLLVRPGG